MDVEATSEELMLRDATRSFIASRSPRSRIRDLASSPTGFDVDDWATAASLGWFGMLAPEEHGGVGIGAAGVVPAAIVAEELGRMLHPGPFLPVNVLVDTLARVGTTSQQRAVLPALVAGTAVATWAIADGPGAWLPEPSTRDDGTASVVATRRGDHYVVSGGKRWVIDAANAADLLVTCRDDDGLVQLLIPADAPGVTVSPLSTMDLGRRIADVELHDVRVELDAVLGDPAGAVAQVDHQLRLAVVLQCAETVGATSAMLEKTVDYAKHRIAFGRPIGSFQAVKHHLAEAVTTLEAAQAATWAATRSLAADAPDAARMVHIAKAFVGARCPTIVETCMQVHGGIGMTWEDDSHLFLRRVQSNRMLFGSPEWHADRLCDVVGVAA